MGSLFAYKHPVECQNVTELAFKLGSEQMNGWVQTKHISTKSVALKGYKTKHSLCCKKEPWKPHRLFSFKVHPTHKHSMPAFLETSF